MQQELGLSVPGRGDTRIVRCLSLWQPWASLMAAKDGKMIETRDWETDVRGEIFIHAASTAKGIAEARSLSPSIVRRMEDMLGVKQHQWRTSLPMGCLVAVGNLVDCLPGPDALEAYPDQEPFGFFGKGRFGHVYEDLRRIEPIKCKGSQKWFNVGIPLQS